MDSFKLSEPYFSQVKAGQKTVEGRLNINKWTKAKPGVVCTVHSVSGKDEIKVKITSVVNAPSFKILYKMYSTRLLPTVEKEHEDTPWGVYNDFYNPELEHTHGVVGITFDVVS